MANAGLHQDGPPGGGGRGPETPVSRREFVGKGISAAAGAALLGSRGLGASGAAAEPRPRIRAGFLGTAYSHFAGKYKILSEGTDWELVGACEADAATRARGPRDVTWLEPGQLFERADVVVVESGEAQHGRDAIRALAAGRHVHVEKPPAATGEEMRRMLALAREKGLILQVGYMWRQHPGFTLMLEAARQGWLGEIYQVRAHLHTQLAAERRGEWAEFQGGSLFEQGSHVIDPLIRLLGRPKSVKAFLQHRGLPSDALQDNNVAVFEFERALGVVTNSIWQPNASQHRAFEILGTEGTATLRPIEPPALALDLARPAGPYRSGVQAIPLPAYERYVGEFEELAACVRGERKLSVDMQMEWEVQEALLRACGHMVA
jgi:predicted dehydrogenase